MGPVSIRPVQCHSPREFGCQYELDKGSLVYVPFLYFLDTLVFKGSRINVIQRDGFRSKISFRDSGVGIRLFSLHTLRSALEFWVVEQRKHDFMEWYRHGFVMETPNHRRKKPHTSKVAASLCDTNFTWDPLKLLNASRCFSIEFSQKSRNQMISD